MVFNGGVLQAAAAPSSSRTISLLGGGGIDTQAFNVALSGPLSGSGGLVKYGSGVLLLTGSNSIGGTITVSAGTLQGNTQSINAAIATAAGTNVVVNQLSSGTLRYPISGLGGLTMIGSATLTLAGTNSYTGPTAILGGTIQAAALDNLGLGPIDFSGGTLRFTGVYDPSTDGMTFNSGGGTLDTGGLAIVLANPVGGNGPGTLTKAGTGELTLLADATYTGNTVINAGTLQLGSGGGGAGGLLGNVTDYGLLAFNRSDSVTFPGVVSGSGAVAQLGTGQLTLTGSNTYSGGTTLSAGTLVVSNDYNLGMSPHLCPSPAERCSPRRAWSPRGPLSSPRAAACSTATASIRLSAGRSAGQGPSP